jgi:hypothetical protein
MQSSTPTNTAEDDSGVVEIEAVSVEPAEGGGARIVASSGQVFELKVDSALVASSLIQILQGLPMLPVQILNLAHVEGKQSVVAEWNCERCTFLNAPSRTACEMCDGPKPEAKSVHEPAEAPHAPAFGDSVDAPPPLPREFGCTNISKEPEPKESETVIESSPYPATALGADGTSYDLGNVSSTQTIGEVKETLAAQSGMNKCRQQMFLMDDKREDALELRNHESVAQAMEHATSDTELQLAVMLGTDVVLSEFMPNLESKSMSMIGSNLNKPIGLAFVPNHTHLLLNAEMYGNKISLYDVERPDEGPICQVGKKGTGELEFDGAYGICAIGAYCHGARDPTWADGSVCVVVSERSNNRLQVLKLTIDSGGSSAKFEFVRFIGGEVIKLPHGIAARKTGNMHHVLVADTGTHAIREYDVHDGSLIATYGVGDGFKGFSSPHDLCTLQSGGFAVADRGNGQVQVFDDQGKFSHKFGASGSADGEFRNADAIDSDEGGNILVIDTSKRIQLFSHEGTFIHTVADAAGCTNYHYRAVAWDGTGGRLVVSDYGAKALTMWQDVS